MVRCYSFASSKTLADDLQTLTDLSVFNGERYKDAQHVVYGPQERRIRPLSRARATISAVSLRPVCCDRHLQTARWRSSPQNRVRRRSPGVFGYRQQSVFQLLPQNVGFCSRFSCSNTFNTSSAPLRRQSGYRHRCHPVRQCDGVHHFRAPGDARQRETACDRFRKGGGSGATPICSIANSVPVRPAPLCTSSAISMIPCSSHSARKRCIKAGVAA